MKPKQFFRDEKDVQPAAVITANPFPDPGKSWPDVDENDQFKLGPVSFVTSRKKTTCFRGNLYVTFDGENPNNPNPNPTGGPEEPEPTGAPDPPGDPDPEPTDGGGD